MDIHFVNVCAQLKVDGRLMTRVTNPSVLNDSTLEFF